MPIWTPTRRGLLGAGLAAGLLGPRRALAADPERRFLFLFCRGGWDASMVFAPNLHVTQADIEDGAEIAQIGDLSFVDHVERPDVRAFFESHADRCCIINGIEVRSVAHLRCRQIVLTGSSGASDDWPTTLAANAANPYLFPNVVISGPAYTTEYAHSVARVGSDDQLGELVSGEALGAVGLAPMAGDPEALVDAWVRDRAAVFEAAARSGRQSRFAGLYAGALDDAEILKTGEIPSFEMKWSGCGRELATDLTTALDALEMDLARCAMVQYEGVCGQTWDSHDNNQGQQNNHYGELFRTLQGAIEDLDGRVASDGTPLADRLTILVFSEMGRHPRLNSQNGRDHWTFTSTLLMGAGVRGGQVIGGLDGEAMGEPVDLASGEITDSGTALLPEHLGATLYQLGGLDPVEWTGVDPIEAALL